MSARQTGSSIKRVDLPSGPRWRFRLDLAAGADGKRRQRTLSFKSEAEAVAAQSKGRVEVRNQTYVDPSRVTVSEYLDTWLAGRAKLRPTTRVNYRGHIAHMKQHLGSKRVQQVTRADVASFVSALTREGLTPSTVRTIFVVLRKAMRDAIPELRQTDPTLKVELPEMIERERPTWSPEQVRAFLAQVDDDPLVGCWHLTMRGLRRGEVVGLRWSDVDLANGVVRIRHTRVRAGTEVVDGPPKTQRGKRDIPIDGELGNALKLTRERTVSRAQVVPLRQRGEAGSNRLVAVDALGEALRPEAYGDAFARHAKAAGLPPIRLHDARHTVLTEMLLAGVAVHVVARFAGHDPAVTLRTYAHAADDATRAAADTIGRLFAAR